MNLTERLDKHLQSIREEADKRILKVDLQKLYSIVPERNSNYIEKTIYEFFLKPLEKKIEAKQYINHLERLNRKSNYLEMIKAFYLAQIKILKRLKITDKYGYESLTNKFGPLNKDNVYDWFYSYYIEDQHNPEPSEYWYEGGYDDKFEELIESEVGFTAGEIQTIDTLMSLFWDRLDRLEDNESQQKVLVTQLYDQRV